MTLADILTLAKQGFKASDIKELIALADSKEEPKKDPEPEPDKKDTEPETKKDPEPEPDKKDPEPDYKKLYEESQKTVKKLQADNRKKDAGTDKKTPEDIALEHVNDILKGI